MYHLLNKLIQQEKKFKVVYRIQQKHVKWKREKQKKEELQFL